MRFLSLSQMPFSSEANWPELARVDSTVARMFWLLVLPLSLLPPAMIYLAGKHYGGLFADGLSSSSSGHIAMVFLLGEIVSVSLMGWLVKQVANTWNGLISYRMPTC